MTCVSILSIILIWDTSVPVNIIRLLQAIVSQIIFTLLTHYNVFHGEFWAEIFEEQENIND